MPASTEVSAECGNNRQEGDMRGYRGNKIVFIVMLCITTVLISACQSTGNQEEKTITRTKVALDTVCTITAYGISDETVIDQCFNRIKEIENKMGVNLTSSEVSNIKLVINDTTESKCTHRVNIDSVVLPCKIINYSKM